MKRQKLLRTGNNAIILSLIISLAIIFSTSIISKTLLNLKKYPNEVIEVTGYAQKFIISDHAKWECKFSVVDSTLNAAYELIEEQYKAVSTYLLMNKIENKQITKHPLYVNTIYEKDAKGKNTNKIAGYSITQRLTIESDNVNRIKKISEKSTELIGADINFVSMEPEFYCSNLDGIKIAVLAEASMNAKERAESMLKTTRNKVGPIRSSRMGVFQITTPDSTNVSDYGINDTSTIKKKITAVVTISYSIR
ncbi:MAG: SIMPL domain-containing protein [Cyanobacteriota bacterium]